MVDQVDLFQRDLLQDRLTKSQFDRILKKGFDPAYVIRVRPDDRVTISERWVSIVSKRELAEMTPQQRQFMKTAVCRHCVVLSKGRLDQDRRVVAQTDSSDKQWLVGLYVGLLRRQVKGGTVDVKAWAFETLLDLERTDVGFVNQTTLENWTKDLITKDNDIQNLKTGRRKGGTP